MKADEIRKMTINQRISVMEQIWTSLIEARQVPNSPSWHQDVLESRRKRIDSGEAKFLTIDELKKMKSI
ncbi:MAG TPA: addiction module component CHP02574 family protein [Deltaproteobacteria bacterium]|nr:MAG: addiction module component CHP02574 family protein [Deltaproteobacteria bacterium]HDM78297.1 addiction module component CHP02574 family protein [Deltaproteobacteria bacterium]